MAKGLAYVPQGRMIFPTMTVEENIETGLVASGKTKVPGDIYELFPVLLEMKGRRGGNLSGGQQQQLAIARALATKPKVLLLDEPTEGIQPSIIKEMARHLERIRDERGLSIVVSEQVLSFALDIADRVLVIENGEIVQRRAARRASMRRRSRNSFPSELRSLTKGETAMPETLIKVDLTKSAYENDKIHNRWHPDIPMVAWVKPGDDFIIETYDWTGGFIKNNDSADDVRDIDLSIVHFLSGPIGVKGAEPGDLLVVDLLDVGPLKESLWGFNGFFSKKNGGGFLTDHFPLAQKSIWDIQGHLHHVAARPGRELRRADPSRPDRLPARSEAAGNLERPRGRPHRHQPGARAAARQPAVRGDRACGAGEGRRRRPRSARKARAPCRRASTAATATSRTCRAARRSTSRSTCRAAASRWATCTSARATARSPSAAPSRWPAGCT